jgi:hypothetical protein
MVAAEFEYRHRFWMIVLVYGVAYAFYNLDHLNILYSIVPWDRGVVQKTCSSASCMPPRPSSQQPGHSS